MHLLDAPLAIVDLETTGTDPAADRVTEIAVLEVDGFEQRGFRVRAEWSTLVNPGTGIPSPIQALTGITDEMVAAAPSFAELAAGLHERLAGRVFVAHNARFDYGFLRREFDRAGIKFTAKTLCTVRLSRRLYPGQAHHNLDSLIARHGIDCRARHRAAGDADALWQFLRIAEREHGEEVVAVAARQIARQPTLPPQLERAALDAVPEAPGVYLFYGEGSQPLYIGKSASMRTRVLSHFSGPGAARAAELSQRVRRIDWRRTAGELGALLLEARLVKELAPEFNRRLLRHARLAAALASWKAADWPHPGPLGIVEQDGTSEETEVHVVERWCYLGAARSDAELAELLEGGRRGRFDFDHYRILARHLGKRGVRTVRLAAPCTAS